MNPVKKIFSYVVGVIAVSVFIVSLIVGAQASDVTQSTEDDLLLTALAFGGAIVSLANGFGRRTSKEKGATLSASKIESSESATRTTNTVFN